jgi:hypothetical protein
MGALSNSGHGSVEIGGSEMEKCCFCGGKFTVSGWTQDHPGHCWHEDINCPWCGKTVRTARNDWGTFDTHKVGDPPTNFGELAIEPEAPSHCEKSNERRERQQEGDAADGV